MARVEYYDDPAAPAPNSLVVAASAVVANERGEVLIQRRADSGLWALPGGGMKLDETLPGAAVREVEEETGYEIEVTGLVGTYTDPLHIIAYSDGEVRRQFNVCFRARLLGGELRVSDESLEVRWVPVGELGDLPMHHTQRLRLRHYREDRHTPHLG
ncbi:Putative MutT/NUDIX-like protein [Mycobacterium tuberculosis]|nr:Putative MutT/NUDIX-like protein [Mycobacterium tuberculosis]